MKHGNKVVMGIFNSRMELEAAVDMLKAERFRSEDISVLLPQKGDDNFGHEKKSKAPEGAAIGAGAGAAIGGALGWLVGIGTIATIPALGIFISAGPIMAALSGAAVAGATGGLAGALIGWGIPEYEAKRYEGLLKSGGHLLSVHADDLKWAGKAKSILQDFGAHHISTTHEVHQKSDSGIEPPSDAQPPFASTF